MEHQIIDWIIEGQPDLDEVKAYFEESWILLRTLKPVDFAAIFLNLEQVESTGHILALILLGIAYYRFEKEEKANALYLQEAWASVKEWWGPLEPGPVVKGPEQARKELFGQ